MKRNPKKRIISVCILLYRKITYSRVLCKNIICEQENFLKMVRGGGVCADSTLCIRLRLILFVPCYKNIYKIMKYMKNKHYKVVYIQKFEFSRRHHYDHLRVSYSYIVGLRGCMLVTPWLGAFQYI